MLKLLVLAVLSFGCTSSNVQFEKPLPPNGINEKEIPGYLVGEYFSVSEKFNYLSSKKIEIKPTAIVLHEHFKQKIAKLDFDTIKNLSIVNNTVIELNGKDTVRYFFTMENDTLSIPLDYEDTLFAFDRGDLLRKAGSFFYLNIKQADVWDVFRIKQTGNDKITLYSPNNENDIELLNKITGITPADSVKKIYNLNKKQFKKFCRKGGFSVSDDFEKLKAD